MKKVDMEKWIKNPLKEQMRLNKENGITADSIFGVDTKRRKEFDEMVEKTMRAFIKKFKKEDKK